MKVNNAEISKNFKICNSFFLKATGLRFKNPSLECPYVFFFDNSQIVLMDMMFVFHSIDVVFLDKEKTVIELKKKFLPFAFYKSKKEASYIIEFEDGTIDKFNIKLSDKIDF